MSTYGPFRLGADGKILVSASTPIRDYVAESRAELREERSEIIGLLDLDLDDMKRQPGLV